MTFSSPMPPVVPAPVGISVVCPVFNRTEMLLGMIENLARIPSRQGVTLRVLDYGSPDLRSAAPSVESTAAVLRATIMSLVLARGAGKPVVDFVESSLDLATMSGLFSRAGGINRLVTRHVPVDDIVVAVDVDMRLPVTFFDVVRTRVKRGHTAAVFSFNRLRQDGTVEQRDRSAITPIAFFKSDAARAGGFALSQFARKTTWGDEDAAFLRRLQHVVGEVVRVDNLDGITHMWHPREKDNPWYGLSGFYSKIPKIERLARATEEKNAQARLQAAEAAERRRYQL